MKTGLKSLREAFSTVADLLTFRYPSFVYRSAIPRGQIPVFCFHSADPLIFEQHLTFLSENSYATLDAEEYHAVLTRERSAPEKAVVLTFDDGWGSLWSVAYPLLREYGIKVVVFIAPGRIENATREWPDLDDLRAGRAAPEHVFGRDSSEQPLLTWEEVERMHQSGLADFQSHSYSHSLVHKSPRIVDFVSPTLLNRYSFLEIPEPHLDTRFRTRPLVKLGEPLYESTPRLSDELRVVVDLNVTQACVLYVEQHGGRAFFDSKTWRAELAQVAKEQSNSPGHEWRYETETDHLKAIQHELSQSKQAIEARLSGKTVRHLCYPWHSAGRTAIRESKKAGYVTNFWGKVRGRYYNLRPPDPYRVARVGGDFFLRLPGKGRVALFRILIRKLTCRACHGSPYLTH